MKHCGGRHRADAGKSARWAIGAIEARPEESLWSGGDSVLGGESRRPGLSLAGPCNKGARVHFVRDRHLVIALDFSALAGRWSYFRLAVRPSGSIEALRHE